MILNMYAANKVAPNFIFKNVLQQSDTGLLQYFNLIKDRSSGQKLNREILVSNGPKRYL